MKPASSIWSPPQLRALHAEYMSGRYISCLAKRRLQRSQALLNAWSALGLPLKPARVYAPRKRVAESIVAAMHADYMAGMSYGAVERKHHRCHGSAKDLFACRGLECRTNDDGRRRTSEGTFANYIPKTASQITAIINSAQRIIIPRELLTDWRHWSLDQRAALIRRLTRRLRSPRSRPDLPFSANVEPYDYGSRRAWDIVAARNAGRSSRDWVAKVDIRSQGVIWDNRLWFWSIATGGYVEGIRWTRGRGRALLHRAIWESTHGPLPTTAVVRFVDRNPNNLSPSNLTLSDKNEVCRANQAAAITRKSRERAALLLTRAQKTNPNHPHHDIIKHLQKG